MHFIPTTQTQLNRLKDRAKALRGQFERLGHARDAAAKELGYSDFHHAVHCAALTAAQRATTPQGCDTGDDRLLARAIERLRDLLTGDAAVDLNNPRVRTAMQDFQGLRVAGLLAKGQIAENPRAFFNDALIDFNVFHGEDFAPTISNSGALQRERGYRLWTALLDDLRSSTYHTLYCYAYMKVFASYAAGLGQMSPNDPAYAVSDKLLTVMQLVMECRGVDDALDIIQEKADELMPANMNVSARMSKMDMEHASSWWSRIQAMVSVEMAGVCSILPFDMIATQIASGAVGRLPFAPLYSPTSPALRKSYVDVARARWSQLPP